MAAQNNFKISKCSHQLDNNAFEAFFFHSSSLKYSITSYKIQRTNDCGANWAMGFCYYVKIRESEWNSTKNQSNRWTAQIHKNIFLFLVQAEKKNSIFYYIVLSFFERWNSNSRTSRTKNQTTTLLKTVLHTEYLNNDYRLFRVLWITSSDSNTRICTACCQKKKKRKKNERERKYERMKETKRDIHGFGLASFLGPSSSFSSCFFHL